MGLLSSVKREWDFWSVALPMRRRMGFLGPEATRLVPDEIEDTVDKYPNNIAFIFEGEVMTYSELESLANSYAHWALSEGLKPGDCVALFMENRPTYVACWYGLSKVGIVTALINSNLQSKGLAHCVNVASAQHMIVGVELADNLDTARNDISDGVQIWSEGGPIVGAKDLNHALDNTDTARPDPAIRKDLRGADMCMYVYTSGTTGLPKAARLPYARVQGMMHSFVLPTRTKAKDRVYMTLPLYHGTGGICGVGIALLTGAALVLRKKFSASEFWDDAVREKATVFVYIGELCRYLLNTPPHPLEKKHKITRGFGNGMRGEVWEPFLERFNIDYVAEFYGSTEGNVSFISFDGKPGTVGRMPKYMMKNSHVRIVKFDIESEEPIRDENGFCILADDSEAGEAIGKIDPENASTRFEGYSDAQQTEKKILRDVFEKGDMWFRTGDLLSQDEHGYYRFVDRIGDTYRWKSENVSTNEVGDAITRFDGIETANVYGMEVPGADGRAGMAAITLNEGVASIEWKALKEHMDRELPAYARPIFYRLQHNAETTGTFKYRKVELQKEGYNPDLMGSDELYFANPEEQGELVRLDKTVYDKLMAGGYRL